MRSIPKSFQVCTKQLNIKCRSNKAIFFVALYISKTFLLICSYISSIRFFICNFSFILVSLKPTKKCTPPMKKLIVFLLFTFAFNATLFGQTPTSYVSEEFKWKINTPLDFRFYTGEEWKIAQKIPDSDNLGQSKILLVFQKDNTNYAEFSSRYFDPETEGDYDKALAKVNGLLYETLHGQMIGAAIETEQKNAVIDGLTFNLFILSIKYPSAQVIQIEIYSRLFENNREFTASILYGLPEQGKLMLEAFTNSSFGK